MNNNNNNGRGIFYGVIGVATLVVAIIGATFAYFTATANNTAAITGNAASVTFNLDVKKVTTADEKYGGMIPMSNSMVEAALKGKTDTDASNPKICQDDNGNAVCQVYKITVKNGGSAGMYLDGYVTLTGGSGTIADTTAADYTNLTGESAVRTTMRWAQAFCKGTDNTLTSCTTAGKTTTGATGTGVGFTEDWSTIEKAAEALSATSGFNREQIKKTADTITATGTFSSNSYDIINTNYIRISDHAIEGDAPALSYTRSQDNTSALVYNQFLSPAVTGNTVGTTTDSDEELTDAQVYYIVVWLSETGKNQTVGAEGAATATNEFFKGTVYFASAQGSEVTATFSGYTAVKSDNAVQSGS